MKVMESFGALAAEFERNTIGALVMVEAGLHKAVGVIEKDAKRRLGHYQGEVGPFQEWAELEDSTREDRVRRGYTPDDPLLRNGDLKNAITSEVAHFEGVVGVKFGEQGEGGADLGVVAQAMEFGAPARPFIGPAAFVSNEKVQGILGGAMVSGLFGGQAIHPSLGYNNVPTSE